MSKKTLRRQTKKMLMAALFAMLCVGIYAHVDSWVVKSSSSVLGQETSKSIGGNLTVGSFVRKMWCRLRFGRNCQFDATVQTNMSEEGMSTDVLIDRELRNIENEVKNDQGEIQGSSYWSM